VGTLSGQTHRLFAVHTDEDVGVLRRAAAAMAAGLDGIQPGHAELVATELATNLIRHATSGGYVLLRRAGNGIEQIAVDGGPGMPPARLRPRRARGAAGPTPPAGPGGDGPGAGWPAAGSLGVGLAGVERLSRTFDCSSGPRGTVVLARVGTPEPLCSDGFRWGGVNVPLAGAGESGDSWAVAAGRGLAAMVVDGLGHGPDAAVAAKAAISAFRTRPLDDPPASVLRAHEAMRGTRGGVLAVCVIDPGGDRVDFAGVGNVSGCVLLPPGREMLVGRDGTVGTHVHAPRARAAAYRWGPGAVLILATDGLRSRWDPLAYPGLLGHDPAVIAATLYRDHARGTDDAAVLVVADTRGAAR
jgi:anti-sigma regulatory factor (Ser/Thr protein kinase)